MKGVGQFRLLCTLSAGKVVMWIGYKEGKFYRKKHCSWNEEEAFNV